MEAIQRMYCNNSTHCICTLPTSREWLYSLLSTNLPLLFSSAWNNLITSTGCTKHEKWQRKTGILRQAITSVQSHSAEIWNIDSSSVMLSFRELKHTKKIKPMLSTGLKKLFFGSLNKQLHQFTPWESIVYSSIYTVHDESAKDRTGCHS